MPYVVEIRITAETEIEALKTAGQEIQKIQQTTSQANQSMAQGTQAAAARGAQGLDALAAASSKALISHRQFGSVVTVVASQVGGLGPVANIASNAITTMALSSGPAGIALGALAATVGFLIYRVDQARERLRQLSEIELAALAREQRGLSMENEIKKRVEVLRSTVPEITEIIQKYRELRLELEKQGARPQALAAADQARDLEIAGVRKKQAEEAKRRAEEAAKAAKAEAEAIAQARESLVSQIEATRQQTIAFQEGEAAAALYGIAILSTSDAVKKLGAEGQFLLGVLRDEKLALIERKLAAEDMMRQIEQQEKNQEKMNALYDAETEALKKNTLATIDHQAAIGNVNAEMLDLATGSKKAGDELRLLTQIQEAQARIATKDKLGLTDADVQLLERQTDLYKAKLQSLNEVTLDFGRTVSSAIGDAFEGIILGTSKLADVGKNFLTAVGRDIIKFFADSLAKKLGFEDLIFTNLRGFLPAANAALQSGGQGIGGQGGLLSALFGGGGGTGGGGGGILSLISGMGGIPNVGGPGWTFGMGGSFPTPPLTGASGGGGLFGVFPGVSIGGLGAAGMGGWSIGNLINGTPGGIGGSIGSIAGTLIGSYTGATGAVTGMLSGILGATLGGLLGSMIIPGIGMIIGALMSLIQRPPNPTVIVRSKLEGFFYDELENAFKFGSITSKGKGIDISGSAVRQTTDAVQQQLEQQSRVWTDILNLFPTIVHNSMIPALELANAQLNRAFARMKFTENGSMNIEQELKQFAMQEAPGGFFAATRPVIGAGLQAALQMAGLTSAAEQVMINWGDVGDLTKPGMYRKGGYPGLTPPAYNKKDTEGMQKFVEAISTFADLTGRLATVSAQGIAPFLPTADIEAVSAEIQRVLNITEGEKLAPGVEQLQKALQPFTDYLNKAVQDAANLFGNSMMAALQAVTASDAQTAFLDNLRKGTQDIVFKGIVQAFLASANFSDLLAPVQKIIQDFTEQAANTFQTPDIEALQAQILPAIDAVLARGEALAPLIQQFQQLGANLSRVLGGEVAQVTETQTTVFADAATTALANGLAAAFQAATASDAQAAFLANLQSGVAQAIVNSLSAGFVQSMAQQIGLKELMKPIEDLMSQFTAEGGPSAVTLRATILPIMDEILKRAQSYAPFIELLQGFGEDLASALGIVDTASTAVQELSDAGTIFGNSITAALNAATQSDAQNAFLNALGEGTRDIIFKGITNAFLQSAQFNTLLAPVQQIISQFTTAAIETGELPDLTGFRAAIFPALGAIEARAQFLSPLIDQLQQIGFDIKQALGLNTPPAPVQAGPTNITINIGQVNDEQDAVTLARQLSNMIFAGTAPQ